MEFATKHLSKQQGKQQERNLGGWWHFGDARLLFAPLLVVCTAMTVLGGCATPWLLESSYTPLVETQVPMAGLGAKLGSMGLAVLAPQDRREDSKQIGFFDPNTSDRLKEFKTEGPLEEELGRDFVSLLDAYGVVLNPAAPVAVRLVVKDCALSGNRRFGTTAFAAVVAIDIEVLAADREHPIYTASQGAATKSTGTKDGSQKPYYEAAFTHAIQDAMRDLARNRELVKEIERLSP